MKLMMDWWYALLVCHKYKLKWNMFYPRDSGCYHWDIRTVSVNPFRNNFISVFMHEVGHHIHHRRIDYDSFFISTKGEIQHSNGRSVYRTLEAEWQASRFSVKSGKGDKKFLTSCFNTYTSQVLKERPNPVVMGEFSKIVDAVNKGWIKINK